MASITSPFGAVERISEVASVKKRSNSGSITVEASIIFPLIIVVLCLFANFMNFYYHQFLVYSALSETANMMAQVTAMSETAASFEGNLFTQKYNGTNFKNACDAAKTHMNEFESGNFFSILPLTWNVCQSIRTFDADDYIGYITVAQTDDASTITSGIDLIESHVRQCLKGNPSSYSQIVNGLDGLDLSQSKILYSNGELDKLITITATYSHSSPFFLKGMPPVPITQSVTVRSWQGKTLPEPSASPSAGGSGSGGS